MEESMKKFAIVIAVCALSLCLFGCQNEPTGKEAVEKYQSISAIENFRDNATTKLGELLEVCDGTRTSHKASDDEFTELFSEINNLCDGVIDCKSYPKACEGMQEQLSECAKEIKETAECLQDAYIAYTVSYTGKGDTDLSKATEHMNKATKAFVKYDDEKKKLESE